MNGRNEIKVYAAQTDIYLKYLTSMFGDISLMHRRQ